MNAEGKRRPPRTPRTPEEVAETLLLKKMREHRKLERFRKSIFYKSCNIFNIICFFVYCELIICFFGPCRYETQYSRNIIPEYGEKQRDGSQVIARLKIIALDGKKYELNVNDYIQEPPPSSEFRLGRDFLLQKEIKARVETTDKLYPIARVSPILFLSFFVGILSCILFSYNLNQHAYSLSAISVINALTMCAFVSI